MHIWDYNSSNDNYSHSTTQPQHFEMQQTVWYYMLCKDEAFTQRLISRYRQLRETYLNEDYLNQYIDDVVAFLGPAVERNFSVWGYTFDKEMVYPSERNPASHAQAVELLKQAIHDRGDWMDYSIESLLQYSHESKVKKFNH